MGLLGFTFGFGARDEGMNSALDHGISQTKAINGLLQQQNKVVSESKISNMFAAIQSFQLGGIQDSLEKITGGPQVITTGLESAMVGYQKEARPFIAQMGLTGKAAASANSLISGLAYSTDIGAGQIAKAFQSLEQQGPKVKDTFKSIGLGLRELVQLESVTGISTEDLVSSTASLTKSYGFSEKSVGKFLDVFAKTAVDAGQGAVAFESLQGALGELDKSLQKSSQFRAMNEADQQQFIEKSILGTQRLAGALTQVLGVAPKQAQQSAQAFANSLLENQSAIEDMFSGTGAEFGELMNKVQAETGFDFAANFVGKAPDEAIKSLITFREELKKTGNIDSMYRLDDALSKVDSNLQFGFLADAKGKDMGSAAIEAMTKLEGSAKNAEGTLAGLSKAGGPIRTLQEQLDRAGEQFQTRLGKIGGGTGGFVRAQINAYGRVGDKIAEMGQDKNWGPLAKQFALATRVGMAAFFLPQKRNVEQQKALYASLGDAVGKGGFMGKIEAVKKMGLAGIFFDSELAATDMAGAVKKAEKRLAEIYDKIVIVKLALKTFMPVFAGIGGAAAGVYGLVKAFNVLWPVIRLVSLNLIGLVTTVAGVVGWPVVIALAVAGIILAIANLPDDVQNKFAEMIDKVSVYLGKFATILDDIDGAAIYAKIKKTLTSVIDSIVGFFTGAETTDKLNGSVTNLGDKIGGVFKSAFGLAKEFAKPAMEDLMDGLDKTLNGQSKTGSAVAVGLAAYIGGPLALLAAPAALGTIPEDVRKNILSSFDVAPDLGEKFKGWASTFGTKIREFVAGIPQMMLDAVSKFDALTTSGGSFLGDLADKITSAIQSFDLSGVIQSFFDNLFGPKTADATSKIDWGMILEAMMTGLFSAAKAIWYVIKFVGEIAVTLGIELFKALYTIQKNITEGVLGIINDSLRFMINSTINGMKSLMNGVIEGLNWVREKVGMDKIALFEMTPVFNEKKAEQSGEDAAKKFAKGANGAAPKVIAPVAPPTPKPTPNPRPRRNRTEEILTEAGVDYDAMKKKAKALQASGDKVALAAFQKQMGDMGAAANKIAETTGTGDKLGKDDAAMLQNMARNALGAESAALASGQSIMGAKAEGIAAGAPAVVASMTEAQRLTMGLLPQKGIPIAATVPFAKLPEAGKLIMELIAGGMSLGITSMTTQVTSALASISGDFQNGAMNIGAEMNLAFEKMGTNAAGMFAKGVIDENARKLIDIQEALAGSWGSAIANIQVVDTSTTESTAVLSIDSISAITNAIKNMQSSVVAELRNVTYNTGKTAEFTAMTAGQSYTNLFSKQIPTPQRSS